MKSYTRFVVLISLFVFATYNLSAWGKNGHRIVAEICNQHLSEAVKQELQAIMGPDYLEELANWPDYIKSESGWKFADSWHYTTVHEYQTIQEVRDKYAENDEIDDAIEAIELVTDILRGDQKATEWLSAMMDKKNAKPLRGSTKATALAFLVHLVGDIHQPMHVGKNKDRGGNNINVLYFSERTNIHAVWDTDIIEHEKLSYTEFARFINKTTPAEVNSIKQSTLNQWAQESITLREDIYSTIYDYVDRETGLPSFSWNYQHDYIVHVKDRLLKGGIRLAGLLEDIFS